MERQRSLFIDCMTAAPSTATEATQVMTPREAAAAAAEAAKATAAVETPRHDGRGAGATPGCALPVISPMAALLALRGDGVQGGVSSERPRRHEPELAQASGDAIPSRGDVTRSPTRDLATRTASGEGAVAHEVELQRRLLGLDAFAQQAGIEFCDGQNSRAVSFEDMRRALANVGGE